IAVGTAGIEGVKTFLGAKHRDGLVPGDLMAEVDAFFEWKMLSCTSINSCHNYLRTLDSPVCPCHCVGHKLCATASVFILHSRRHGLIRGQPGYLQGVFAGLCVATDRHNIAQGYRVLTFIYQA